MSCFLGFQTRFWFTDEFQAKIPPVKIQSEIHEKKEQNGLGFN